eukprot:GHVH01001145.1.p1 GENE.GHVH01001145.1~~GHVH01001145.1.p1  ORF type:complete len:312 (+),score=38.78 GHVH01001145.1:29-964(+)
MRFIPLRTPDQVSAAALRLIVDRVNAAAKNGMPIVLGLSVGATMARIYQLLAKAFEAGLVDFDHVLTFNIDEYVGLPVDHPETTKNYMFSNFFNYVNVRPENIFIMNGNAADTAVECDLFEQKIQHYGGIDLLVGPAGTDGHIAYNEPYSSLQSRTRHKYLALETLESRKRYFNNSLAETPKEALTFGVGTILDSRELLVVATGLEKAFTVRSAVEGQINHMNSVAACCQMHKYCTMIVDRDATSELKVKTYRYFKDIKKETVKAFKTIDRNSDVRHIFRLVDAGLAVGDRTTTIRRLNTAKNSSTNFGQD